MNRSSASYNLLLVDDHRLITDGLYRILDDEAMIGNIFIAHNGLEAVDAVTNNIIDCVIMDINMPELNGIDAAKRIKEKDPSVKIIAVSMLSDPAIVNKMLKAGASGHS